MAETEKTLAVDVYAGGPPTAWCWCAPPWGRLAW